MAKPTRRQKRKDLRAGLFAGAIAVAFLAVSLGWWLLIPAYLAAVLSARLLAWPTICNAYRAWPADHLACETLVTGAITGCDSHRREKAGDLRAVLSPAHPRSPMQAALRLVRRGDGGEQLPTMSGAPTRITFHNALSIYGIILCLLATVIIVFV